MPNPITTYPFDPTGNLSSNLIVNETHVISPPNWKDNYFIVPFVGPFFQNSKLKVIHTSSQRELVRGVDYVLGFRFIDASRATAKSLYGAISIMDRTLSGTISVTYQTLGGDWAIDEARALQLLTETITNPRTTSWEMVEERPVDFPVIDHEWDLQDMVGMSEVVDEVKAIADAIIRSNGSVVVIEEHVEDFENPHQVTKTQVGLSKVENLPVADSEDFTNQPENSYVTTDKIVGWGDNQVKVTMEVMSGAIADASWSLKGNLLFNPMVELTNTPPTATDATLVTSIAAIDSDLYLGMTSGKFLRKTAGNWFAGDTMSASPIVKLVVDNSKSTIYMIQNSKLYRGTVGSITGPADWTRVGTATLPETLDHTTKIVCNGSILAVAEEDTVYLSTDKGNNFNEVLPFTETVKSLFLSSDLFICSDKFYKFDLTTSAGLTEVTPPTPGKVEYVHELEGGNLIYFYKGGFCWNSSTNKKIIIPFKVVKHYEDSEGLLLYLNELGVLYRSTDRGKSFYSTNALSNQSKYKDMVRVDNEWFLFDLNNKLMGNS